MSTHRTNILKLATKISMESLTYTGITFNDPEYRILDPIIDDDMCEVFLHLKLNTNRTVEEVAKRTGCSVEHAQKQLDKLVNTGAVRFRERDGKTYYYYPIWVPGIMEGILSNREQCDTYPDLGVCFEEYTRTRIAILAPNASTGMSFMRVIPVEAAVKNNTKVASYDEVSTLIENAKAISVGPCSCRRSRRLMGEGCGHLEEDMCIYLNDNAYTYTKSGAHHMITKEEAYEILKRAEDNGLVHELNQSDGFDGTTAICNCCHCSCYALRIGSYFNTPDMLRTNYVAEVNPDLCTACGACVENCHPNALKLGKKLCSIEPIPGPEPDPLPADYFWGKAQYNEDFRTDRSDVLDSGTSPCKAANPASLPYQGILKLAAQGRNKQAYKMITNYIPFPAIVGRVAEDLPERVCTRASVDSAVAINEVLKSLGDWGLENREVPEVLNPQGIKFDKKIAVIGAGPAGLSCAYYLAIKGYPVTVFERDKKIGGKMMFGIPSFDLDKKLVEKELSILEKMGVEFKTGVNVGKDVKISQLVEEQGYEAVFLGVGASAADKLGVAGQDLKGVVEIQTFMRGINSTRRPKVSEQVVVLGGNQATLDAARAAVRLGAKKVTVVAEKLLTDARIAKKEGVQFLFGSVAEKIDSDAKGNVKSIVLKNSKTGETKTVKAGTVIYDGQRPDLLAFTDDVKLLADAKALLRVEEMTYQTSVPYIFAGGDVATGPKYVMDAMVAGREAAISIHRYVHPGQDLKIGRDHFDYKAFDMKNTVLPESSGESRQETEEVAVAKAIGSFQDLRGSLTPDQVKKEASRCLGCGVVHINENMCVGCGICTTKCNFGAITLKKVRDDKGGPYFNTLGKVGINAVKRYSSVAVKKVARPLGKKS